MEVEVEMELAVCCRTSKVWRGGIYRPCQPVDYGIIGVNHPAAALEWQTAP